MSASSCAGSSCDVGRGRVRAQLVRGLGADDDGRDRRARQQPGERDLIRLQSPCTAESLDRAGNGDLGRGEPGPLEALVADDVPVEHAEIGEQAAVQRRVGDDGQPELRAGGRELAFRGPVDQVVLDLHGDGRVQATIVRDPQGTGDLPGGVVGQADVADLALPDEVVVGLEGLLQRGVRVGVVGVVEVEVVGLQAAQAGLDLPDDMPARQAAVVDAVADDAVGLGGDHHLVAATAEGAADELLGGFAVGGGRRTWAGRRPACFRTRRRCRRS